MASSSPWSSISSSISSSVSRDSVPSDSTSAANSASSSPPGCDGELRLLVALVALNVLRRCDSGRSQPSDVLVAHAKRLVALTLGELLLPDNCVSPASRGHQHRLKHRSVGGVCRAVLRDLRRNVCSSRSVLLSMILLQDPAVDAAFVKALQSHAVVDDSHQQGGDNTKSSRGSGRISFGSARRRLDDFLESLNVTLTTLFM